MAATTQGAFTITWRDAKGNTAINRFPIWYDLAVTQDAQTLQSNVYSALFSLTNAAPARLQGAYDVVEPLTYGAVQTYEDVEDKARLTYSDANGRLHSIQVPAPIGTGAGNIFLADGESVASAKVAALTAAVTTAVGSAIIGFHGVAWTTYVGGVRARRKLRRKLSIYSKSANLDEPGE